MSVAVPERPDREAVPERLDREAVPERLDHFMARAAAAYYSGRDPFGAPGDFTTAPEMTQAFGEVLGLWCVVTWRAMGRPDPVLLAEAGPGRGTLLVDALRAARGADAAFARAARPHLIETSTALRVAQRTALEAAGVEAAWHDRLGDLPPGPLLLLGNEFLDALPIRQFEHRGGAWRERWVAGGGIVLRDVGDVPEGLLPPNAPEGEVREVSEPARALAAGVGARIAAQGGAALFLDYGPAESGPGDSLQAVRRHGAADPLGPPGEADLSAHVDFGALAGAARAAGAVVYGPVPQGLFLRALGLPTRAAALAALDPRSARSQLAAVARLTAPEFMGRLFKALCVAHPALPAPAGFEASPPP